MVKALTVVQLLISIGIIVTILLQSGRSAGLSGTIAGGAETIFGKKKGMDEMLTKMTAGLAVVFLIVTLALSVIQ